MKHVKIWTDGACNGQKNGGIGIVLETLHKGEVVKKEVSIGYHAPTTNNRMELRAAIHALSLLKTSCIVTLYTDSQYVQQGISSWINNWKKNGWRSANKKPVLNRDLWEKLDELTQKHKINWEWVKGHASDKNNNIADELAVNAAKQPTEDDIIEMNLIGA